MWIRIHEQPTGCRLFRTCAMASLVAVLVGGLILFSCWVTIDYDLETGRSLGYFGVLLVGILGAGVLIHYPWSPFWVKVNGCKPQPNE